MLCEGVCSIQSFQPKPDKQPGPSYVYITLKGKVSRDGLSKKRTLQPSIESFPPSATLKFFRKQFFLCWLSLHLRDICDIGDPENEDKTSVSDLSLRRLGTRNQQRANTSGSDEDEDNGEWRRCQFSPLCLRNPSQSRSHAPGCGLATSRGKPSIL